MPITLLFIRRAAIIAGLALGGTLLAHAQGGNADGKTAEQVYKNVQVLKGVPAEQLNDAMHVIRAALGVSCEFCHVETDRSLDTKAPKQTARKMMLMMMALNKGQFGGQQEVTCYTCHRGHPIPRTSFDYPTTPDDQDEEAKVALPSVDQILAKYVKTLGGEQAIRKVTSRVITGTQYLPTTPGGVVPVPATMERDQKVPNMIVNIYHAPTYAISDGFDGAKAWSQDMRGRVTEPLNSDQVRARRDADFYLPLDLKQQYAKMEVDGIERVNDRDTYVVVCTLQGELPDRLYFDTETGLLLRKQTLLPSPVGDYPFEVDYGDYRDTGSGVKFPYLITMYPAVPGVRTNTPSVSTTIHVTKVQDNIPLDNSKFAKPETKAAAAQ
jgi:photosynthetic reaction center cytochrome c subunit